MRPAGCGLRIQRVQFQILYKCANCVMILIKYLSLTLVSIGPVTQITGARCVQIGTLFNNCCVNQLSQTWQLCESLRLHPTNNCLQNLRLIQRTFLRKVTSYDNIMSFFQQSGRTETEKIKSQSVWPVSWSKFSWGTSRL